MRSVIDSTLATVADNVARVAGDEAVLAAIERGGAGLVDTLRDGGKVYAAGNGGSLCDAMHFAEELSGSFRDVRPALAASAIADPAHLTCVGNDFGFEQVFARYVQGHVREGDAFVAISTSGTSANVVLAAEAARAQGGFVLALTGSEDSPLGALADVDVCTPAGVHSDRVQELHIVVIHLLVELVERSLFPSNYAS
ncbi:MAG TPA: SIS domain-containing protein [Baekduia sp.]|uniref:D-sedoheptulose-7-phosphate isomerase n=1 Tax=Baekduia sp. TaxID=2600305 RepID=UPI002D790AED|nr:SIS domain-containing protein [Baekduia sp.]HET6509497.1 SIS domain-containing protein [Baekduia sp.]